MGLWSKIVETWCAFWGDPYLGGLTYDEFEEYEALGEAMEWRRLDVDERGRFQELQQKKDRT